MPRRAQGRLGEIFQSIHIFVLFKILICFSLFEFLVIVGNECVKMQLNISREPCFNFVSEISVRKMCLSSGNHSIISQSQDCI